MSKQVIFDKKNVLVAGGAGFIGSHLCDELIKTCKVICVDNFISGSERNIDHLLASPDFVFINHDLAKPLNLESQADLKEFKIEFQGLQEIYNLACPTSPRRFMENRLAILAANSSVVKNLLDLAVKYQAKFLQASSCAVYGPRHADNPSFKAKESEIGLVDPLSERAAFDEGKRFAETLVANYRDLYGLDAKIVRLFRIYGPRLPQHEDHIIPDYIDSALDNKDVIIHGGPDFSSSFCYVDDALDGIFKLMSSELSGPVNIGSDVDVKVEEVVKKIIQATDSSSRITHSESKLFVSELILPDIKLAKNELNWMPVVTLDNGLKKMIFDIEANKKLQGFGT